MTNAAFMKIHLRLWLIGLSFAPAAAHAADPFLVENGVPRAEIVIAEDPARSTRLAARELQTYLKKISGAELQARIVKAMATPKSVIDEFKRLVKLDTIKLKRAKKKKK